MNIDATGCKNRQQEMSECSCSQSKLHQIPLGFLAPSRKLSVKPILAEVQFVVCGLLLGSRKALHFLITRVIAIEPIIVSQDS